jgi:hypothetical protein
MKSLLVLAAIAILAGACAGSRGCQLCTAPSSPVGFDVTATDSDHTVTMRVGQKLEVVLRARNGMNDWTHPVSNDTSVLSPIVDPAATAARGVTLAAFEAKKQGEVQVTANASPQCSPGSACPMYLAVYSLKVTINS